ncbi:S41 family peptidase [Teichococcus aestuarii]|uniref:Peptidase S41 n=1 Tax=Teichococcus aestuarii TaxID=568898 RepID=A0A2U1VAB3_9PROT|nr:S41 family peptidase [Pseudoroseomonas aestuarii]PWC30860.1 peptidase S41 [Pseudoroseomonas aestuarii]
MLARLLALALLLAGPLAPGLALAQAETGFSRSLTRVVLREAFEAIIERHLEVAAPEEMALWSLRGLGAVDTGLTAEVQGGLLRLYLGGALLAEAPLPSSALAPQGRPDLAAREPAEQLGETLSRLYAQAWAHSPQLRRTGMERLIQAGFDEVFNHLDPYSRYITAEEAWEARQRRVGQSGLGLRVASGPRGSVVVAALEAEGEARRAGLREGDTLLAIDGIPVSARRITQAAELLEGPPDTQVRLSLRRGNQRLTLVLRRPSEVLRSLRTDVLDGILWARISVFSAVTTEQLAEALNNAFAAPGPPRGVVLDLRGNRGGILTQAMGVADAFLNSGVVAQSAGRHPDARRVWQAGGSDLAQSRPVVVLVDGRTASAAEIVAAALGDRGRAVVVGSATLGKGLIQIVVPLPNGAEVLISWSRVLAPLGWPVQGLGVIPALCTSLGLEATQQALQQLGQGASPMQPVLDRARRARAPVPASEVVALRAACPPAEERDLDQQAARALIDNPAAYRTALNP